MEKEYIEREELVRHCKRIIEAEHNKISAPSSWSFAYEQFIEDLEEEPAADVEEVRHGRWIETRRGQKSPEGYYYWNTPLTHVYVCSECGRHEDKKEPYCNCGAKMDGGNDNA